MTMPPDGGLRLRVELHLHALSAAQRQLGDFLAEAGCDADIRFRADLVLEEVVMNIIRHAAPQGASRAVLAALCRDGRATLTVEDDGPEFDPLSAQPRPLAGEYDGGFGLHLIRRQSDAAHYARTRSGNRLELAFGPRQQ
jgi:serine/threonine-protein kinase RsbW